MHPFLTKLGGFARREAVLVISLVCALLSMLAVPPDAAYAGYIDLRVLCLLFCLLVDIQDVAVLVIIIDRVAVFIQAVQRIAVLIVLINSAARLVVLSVALGIALRAALGAAVAAVLTGGTVGGENRH